jgi:hypothetical protein
MKTENNQRNDSKGNGTQGERKQTSQPGAPSKSNRQTGGNKGHRKDESHGSGKNTTKKGPNAV